MGSIERVEREKAEHRKKREELILSAAGKLFHEKGFLETTISDIAGECELTNGAIYLYYRNKDELVVKVMTGISESLGNLLEAEAGTSFKNNGHSRLHKLLKVYSRTFREFRSYHRLDAQFNLMFRTSYPETPLLEDYFKANKRVLDVVTEAVSAGLADGSVKSELNAERTAGLLLEFAEQLCRKNQPAGRADGKRAGNQAGR